MTNTIVQNLSPDVGGIPLRMGFLVEWLTNKEMDSVEMFVKFKIGRTVLISQKGEKFHFHAPTGAHLFKCYCLFFHPVLTE